MYRLPIILILVFSPLISFSEQESPDELNESRPSLFWDHLYTHGGWTLYCGLKFVQPGLSQEQFTITIDHIYPLDSMLKAQNCDSRMQCHDSDNKKFLQMESDLHNQYPVLLDLNNSLRLSEYGEIDGENWRFENCDFERTRGIIEPRPLARGNIARAIFYMHSRYNLPVNHKQLQILMEWNRQDPPSAQEQIRNDRIEIVQGRRNPYIDNPSIAESLAINQ